MDAKYVKSELTALLKQKVFSPFIVNLTENPKVVEIIDCGATLSRSLPKILRSVCRHPRLELEETAVNSWRIVTY